MKIKREGTIKKDSKRLQFSIQITKLQLVEEVEKGFLAINKPSASRAFRAGHSFDMVAKRW
jgi:hypothetical protein